MKQKIFNHKFASFFLVFLLLTGLANAQNSCEKIFEDIYKSGAWGLNEAGEGYSGPGSTLDNAIPYIEFLEGFMKFNSIQTVVDAGCGDWTFSRYVKKGAM